MQLKTVNRVSLESTDDFQQKGQWCKTVLVSKQKELRTCTSLNKEQPNR